MNPRLAVLASGGGTNLQAIIDYYAALEKPSGTIALVASNKASAGALDRARTAEIPAEVFDSNDDGSSLHEVLHRYKIDLVILAGYLKQVPPSIIEDYHGRIINIHPGLLPDFGGPGMYGSRVHRAVLDAGVRVTGVTAHFVDSVYDRGRIITQWPVPVFASDDAGTLASRVLRVEHLVYPRVVDAVAAGRTTLENCAVTGRDTVVDTRPSFTLLPHEDSRLAENIELTLGC